MPETPGAYLDDKEKGEQMFVEDVDSLNAGKGQVQDAMGGVLGTVDVVGEDGGIVLIPTPSSDPRGESSYGCRSEPMLTRAMNRPAKHATMAQMDDVDHLVAL